MPDIILSAPLSGWVAPLDEVPDTVFAERMLGDGVAIDPTGPCLHAPCDGVVLHLHAARHAITLRSAEGADILMHIGLDTVALDGAGFHAHVAEGQQVARGDPLIGLDLDRLVQRARAVTTPMIVTNPDRFRIVRRAQDRLVAMGEPLLWLSAVATEASAASTSGENVPSRTIVVPLAHGIHARPAARLAACARAFDAEVSLIKDGESSSVLSPTGLLMLGITSGATVTIAATGPDAAAARDAVTDLILSGMGEPCERAQGVPSPPAPRAVAADGVLTGITAAPGLALGPIGLLRGIDLPVPEGGIGIADEEAAFDRARRDLAAGLVRRADAAHGPERAILGAHAAMLDDPKLIGATVQGIARGQSAAYAWRAAIRPQADALRDAGNPRLAERADDMRDLERQLIARLLNADTTAPVFPPGTILVADDLLPSQLLALDPDGIAGLVVERGGPTSHVAILAATLGLPALVAVGPALQDIADNARLLLDADAGTLTIDPDPDTVAAAETRIAARRTARAAARAAAADICRTADGVRIEAFANLGSADDATVAVRNGAEGCGLLRTEFLFLDRDAAPDEREQAQIYQTVADRLDGRPLIVRLLDIGGDKPARYLPIAAEENPALGLRGIRVGFAYPDLLATQLRAILRVVPVARCRIMVPMIASLSELRRVRSALTDAAAQLGIVDPVPLGVMIETPAAAVTADSIAGEADFLSIGTNDLTQYALAMDRGNPAVAAGVDGLHPAVLRLIAQSCAGGAAHRRPVGVCGGLASDLLAVPILIGLGVTELSATPASVPDVKALVRRVTMPRCRDHAQHALRLSSPAEVRALATRFLQDLPA
jgi:phosphocarrier protein FPr/phosphocarrier protein